MELEAASRTERYGLPSHFLNGDDFLHVSFAVSFTFFLPSVLATVTCSDQVYLGHTEEDRQERYR